MLVRENAFCFVVSGGRYISEWYIKISPTTKNIIMSILQSRKFNDCPTQPSMKLEYWAGKKLFFYKHF